MAFELIDMNKVSAMCSAFVKEMKVLNAKKTLSETECSNLFEEFTKKLINGI